ncbi:MAG: hypothetical protein AAF348_18700 [Bacteroidota bacterium]
MLKRIVNSSIASSWFNTAVTTLSAIIAIPIVITKLSVEEVNVWFLIGTITAISQGLINGFSITFMRFIAYAYSGVRLEEFKNIKAKHDERYSTNIDQEELKSILQLMRVLYAAIALLFLIILYLVGDLILSKPISEINGNHAEAWTAWYVVLGVSSLNLYLSYFRVFLMGVNQVALIEKTSGFINLIGLFIILLVLFFFPSLLSIVAVYQLITLAILLALCSMAIKNIRVLGIKLKGLGFDKNVFSLVWESAWKSTITTISANFVAHVSGILVAQYFKPAQSASFLFTKRIFIIIERFTQTTFQARLPLIAKYRGRGEYEKLIPFLKQTQRMAFAVFLGFYIMLVWLGNFILDFFDTNVELGSTALLAIFSFSILLRRWSGMNMGVSNQANYILDYITVPVGGVVFFMIIIFFNDVGVNIYPLAQAISIVAISPIIIAKYYRVIKTNFVSYEKDVFLPVLALLSIINIIMFFKDISLCKRRY